MIPYQSVGELAQEAGKLTLDIYRSKDFGTVNKDDGSPVTRADCAAHELILSTLESLTPEIPVLSEESYTETSDILKSERFWLVDPLDGTKDFIAGTGDFTINIALVESGISTAGFVYVPITEELFCAWGGEALKNGKAIKTSVVNHPPVAGVSHFHKSNELNEFLERNQISQVKSVGSSLKFCRLAEGVLDIYPRLGPTSQWDTAAGQAVAEAAGCLVVSLVDKQRLWYGNRGIINQKFVAYKPQFQWK